MKFSYANAYDVRYLLCRFRGFYIRVAWRFQDMPWRHLWRKIIEIKFKTTRLLYFKYSIFKVQPNDTIGESWGIANTFLLGLINATYMHDLKSLVYNHKEQVKYY